MRLFYSALISLFICSANAQQWRDVGGGIDLWVNKMRVDTINDLLYVVGDYTIAGDSSANCIATWNGSTWNTIGNNDEFKPLGFINDIAFFNGDIIVAGSFDSVGTIKANNIARYNGIQWQAIGNGFSDKVNCLKVFQGELYAAGNFISSGTDTTPHIAKWNGVSWEQVGDGMYGGYVFSMIIFDNKLCIGGQSMWTLSQTLPRIASWDGISWASLGGGFNDEVINLGIFQNELYAVGDFTPWAMNPSTRISRWDGNDWQAMPHPTGGNDQRIIDLIEYHNQLYICGFYSNPPNLIKFNGTGYDSLCDVSGYINNLAVYKNELYAGGIFNSINGIPINSIVRYNDGIGVNEANQDNFNELIVFPNPSFNEINIGIAKNGTNKKSSLKIFDQFCRLLYESNFNDNNAHYINTQSWEPGQYIVQYSSNDTLLFKIITILQ